ncbi:MAG: nuclear transport factor 2 family protein [bacterium]|nr:nuclear transport factor 2 family protein [bacterium]
MYLPIERHKENPLKIILVLCLLSLVACQSTSRDPDDRATPEVEADGLSVDEVMDAWHKAASEIDAEGYLGYLSAHSVFIGTDPGERWTKAEFAAYVGHYFTDLGRGWTYLPSERNVVYGPSQKTAWFDERLENTGYGVLRGTGVLQLLPEGWRIVHYSMAFAVPNGKVEGLKVLLGLTPNTSGEADSE